MSGGKPAGIPCIQLLPDLRCALFGKPERPAVCVSLRPTEAMCGASAEEALAALMALELLTAPSGIPIVPGAHLPVGRGSHRGGDGTRRPTHLDLWKR